MNTALIQLSYSVSVNDNCGRTSLHSNTITIDSNFGRDLVAVHSVMENLVQEALTHYKDGLAMKEPVKPKVKRTN